MHVYIASKPGNTILRRCTILVSLIQTCFHPAHISTSKGAYNTLKAPSVTQIQSHDVFVRFSFYE